MNPLEFWSQWGEMTAKMMANTMPYGKADSIGGDPFTPFYEWCDTMNKRWSSVLADNPSPEQRFASTQLFQECYSHLISTWRSAGEEYARVLHIPTLSDIARVAVLVVNLEEKVDTIEDEIEHVKEQATPDNAAMTKITDLEQRLKNVESQMATLVRQRRTKQS